MNSPTATASSGCPHRTVTLHSAVALAAASQKRLGLVAPRRSAIASAANSATAEMATWYGPANNHTLGYAPWACGTVSWSPARSMTAMAGIKMMAAPGSETS